jgi:hypothetical protein
MAPQQCTTLRSAPAYTFGSRAAPPAYAEQVPAPNTYQPRLTSSNFASPKGAGFGTSGRLAPYGERGGVSARVCPAAAATAPAAARPHAGNKNPAPGDYTPQDRLLRSSSPQFTFKGVAAKAGAGGGRMWRAERVHTQQERPSAPASLRPEHSALAAAAGPVQHRTTRCSPPRLASTAPSAAAPPPAATRARRPSASAAACRRPRATAGSRRPASTRWPARTWPGARACRSP